MDNIQGWINLYKPKNISSFKAVNSLKKKFFLKKIGHAGTLDPLAEGVLPIAVGKTTKLIPFITNELKTYNFTIYWGAQTTTDDSDGEVLFKSDHLPKIDDIKSKINNFIGYIKQIPPKVSAVKVNGERAYKLTRNNKHFNILPKDVFVKNLRIIDHNHTKTTFEIICGKGFYVRSFARDISIKLKTFGHISSLERTKVGKFTKKTSILLDDLVKISQRLTDINCFKSSISMLDDILAYEIENDKDLKDLSFGRSIIIDGKKNFNKAPSSIGDKIVFLSYQGDIVSIGKLVGNLFKPNKILL